MKLSIYNADENSTFKNHKYITFLYSLINRKSRLCLKNKRLISTCSHSSIVIMNYIEYSIFNETLEQMSDKITIILDCIRCGPRNYK